MHLSVSRDVLERAVVKARTEYRRVQPDAAPGESWAEFEQLGEYLDFQGPTPPSRRRRFNARLATGQDHE